MLIFNPKTMNKAFINKSVLIADEDLGIAVSEYIDELVNEDPLETFKGQECWVLFEKCDSFNGKEMSFVYLPEYDIAITIISKFISESK